MIFNICLQFDLHYIELGNQIKKHLVLQMSKNVNVLILAKKPIILTSSPIIVAWLVL